MITFKILILWKEESGYTNLSTHIIPEQAWTYWILGLGIKQDVYMRSIFCTSFHENVIFRGTPSKPVLVGTLTCWK